MHTDACVHVRTHVYTHVRTHVRTHVCTQVYMDSAVYKYETGVKVGQWRIQQLLQ